LLEVGSATPPRVAKSLFISYPCCSFGANTLSSERVRPEDLDRSRRIPRKRDSFAEWRDPENACAAMPTQGILSIDRPPKLRLPDHAASEKPGTRLALESSFAVPELQWKRLRAREHGCFGDSGRTPRSCMTNGRPVGIKFLRPRSGSRQQAQTPAERLDFGVGRDDNFRRNTGSEAFVWCSQPQSRFWLRPGRSAFICVNQRLRVWGSLSASPW